MRRQQRPPEAEPARLGAYRQAAVGLQRIDPTVPSAAAGRGARTAGTGEELSAEMINAHITRAAAAHTRTHGASRQRGPVAEGKGLTQNDALCSPAGHALIKRVCSM